MGARRIRREQRAADMKESRRVNGPRKVAERDRRKTRMLELISKQGQLPYTPVVMSWLSMQLDKPSRLLTAADVQKVVGAAK